MTLEFDPEKHLYSYDKKPVPGVSEILRETAQAKDHTDTPSFYRERGIAAHLAISLYLGGTLDEASLDPAIVPYFEQFREWDKKQSLNLPVSERAFYSESLRYAGTIDLICNGVIYDIKCSKKLDKASTWHYRLQGAAYRYLAQENIGRIIPFPFKILLLTGSGEAQVIDLDAPIEAWRHLVALYDIKKERTV